MASELELTSIKHLRQPFETGRKSIEQLITLARKMPAENQIGDWGQWRYSRGLGRGILYAPFGEGGLAAVALGCESDDGDNDIARASFFQAVAEWKQVPPTAKDSERKFAYCLAAFPKGEWFEIRGGEKEANQRVIFGFQENQPDVLQLEQFGSLSSGWFAIDPLRTDPKLEVGQDNIKVSQTLKVTDLKQLLSDNMAQGVFSSSALERIFLP